MRWGRRDVIVTRCATLQRRREGTIDNRKYALIFDAAAAGGGTRSLRHNLRPVHQRVPPCKKQGGAKEAKTITNYSTRKLDIHCSNRAKKSICPPPTDFQVLSTHCQFVLPPRPSPNRVSDDHIQDSQLSLFSLSTAAAAGRVTTIFCLRRRRLLQSSFECAPRSLARLPDDEPKADGTPRQSLSTYLASQLAISYA